MKFLWHSNAPWAGTGYGQQTRLLLSALKDLGHDPSCFCFYGLSGGKVVYDGYECLPNSDFETWGNDVIKSHIERTRARAVISLIDPFVLDEGVWSKLEVPWLAWTPIDSEGIGDDLIRRLKIDGCSPIAMSHFGAEQMRTYEVEPAAIIYHAVDTEVFKPMDKYKCREYFNLDPEAYIVGMVMANKGDRKQYPLHLQAIRRFKDQHDEVKVFLHTEPTSKMGGWDMKSLVALMGLKGQVYSTNQYDVKVVPFEPLYMAMLYNCFDVLMNCSAGEGFGIPIIEAQACGVPVVTHGVTAMPEITINGYTVESQAKGLASHYGWQFAPSVDDMVYRLECVYRMADSASSKAGRLWVEENCSVPVIAAQWDEVLTELDAALTGAVAEARVSVE